MRVLLAVILGLCLALPAAAKECPDGYYNCGGDLCCPK
ncbi:CC domain-containing protein [Litoreibacter meonggei]|uniref:CC domain-containing protein n=1 Tax=Litoreibacter meonggei TaxID=1049199 RepID=A0A497X653_9RHOB|nr:CC domain-containing protein [Litoreibacter meonggei]